MFSPNTTNAAIKCHEKHELFLTKNQSTTKIWIIGIIMFFALCVTVISIAICVGGLVKDSKNIPESYEMNKKNSYIREKFIKENKVLNVTKLKDNIIGLKSKVLNNTNKTQELESNVKEYDLSPLNKAQPRNQFKATNIRIPNQININANDTTESGDDVDASNFNLKRVVFKVMGSLADAAVDGIKSNSIYFYSTDSDEDQKRIIAAVKANPADIAKPRSINTTLGKMEIDNVKSNDNSTNQHPEKNVNNLNKIINIHNKVYDTANDTHNTQISSPDDVMGTVTTNLDLLKDYVTKDNIEAILIPENHYDGIIKNHDVQPESSFKIGEVIKFKDIPAHLSGFLDRYDFEINGKGDAFYDQNDYFYSDNDAQSFYYDYERHTWTNYILDKIQEVYDWITTDMEVDERGTISKGNESATIPQFLQALNSTLIKGDLSPLISKFKNVFDIESNVEFDPERSKRIITNTSSVVSFGLLAIDIILLRNLQLMAWDDQKTSKYDLLNDPDVFAFNSIFMDPSEVKEIYQSAQIKRSNTDIERDSRRIKSENDNSKNVEYLLSNVNVGLEFASFISSTVRAGIHLARAFQNTRVYFPDSKLEYKTPSHGIFQIFSNVRGINNRDSTKSTELDCLWILYCKNLDKATKFDGPYGFLAKLNSVGLRLILGELPLNKVIETLIEETITESKSINCSKLFPRCNNKNAAKIVLENVLINTPNNNVHKQPNVP